MIMLSRLLPLSLCLTSEEAGEGSIWSCFGFDIRGWAGDEMACITHSVLPVEYQQISDFTLMNAVQFRCFWRPCWTGVSNTCDHDDTRGRPMCQSPSAEMVRAECCEIFLSFVFISFFLSYHPPILLSFLLSNSPYYLSSHHLAHPHRLLPSFCSTI